MLATQSQNSVRKFTAITVITLLTLTTGCTLVSRLGENHRFENAEIVSVERQKLIGKWYGKQIDKKGGIWQELSEISDDGTYRFTFLHTSPEGKSNKQIMIGEWGLVGPIHFTISKVWEKDSQFIQTKQGSEKNYEAYEVVALDDKHFRYRSYRTGKEYIVKRVGDDFLLGK